MYRSFFKPLIDCSIALLLIGCFTPLFLIVIIILLFVNKRSSIFFLQDRVGKNENVFKIIKFKTMTDDRNDKGELLPNELRITAFGRFIRKTSIDELPQLFNVLIGDMSIIGPRPLPVRYLDLYNQTQLKRHIIKPGITGWAQVNGRNSISWSKKIELDIWYIENQNFFLDMRIFVLTIIKIFNKKDIDSSSNVGGVSFNGKN